MAQWLARPAAIRRSEWVPRWQRVELLRVGGKLESWWWQGAARVNAERRWAWLTLAG